MADYCLNVGHFVGDLGQRTCTLFILGSLESA